MCVIVLGDNKIIFGCLYYRIVSHGREIKLTNMFDQKSLRDHFSVIVTQPGSSSEFQNLQPCTLPVHQAHLVCLGALWRTRHMTRQDTSGQWKGFSVLLHPTL